MDNIQEITINSRVNNLYDTEENWNLKPDFIPNRGEMVVFAPDKNYSYPRTKLGDGVTLLKDLQFVDSHKSQVQIITWEADD